MRVLVFSDVHANLPALEAVLADAGAVDAYWFLGDLVGYGPDPKACIARLRGLQPLARVMGNHDAAVLGQMPLRWFNEAAQKHLLWTQDRLDAEDLAFLATASQQQIIDDVTLVHGSPRAPITEYLLGSEEAEAALRDLTTPWGFFGHTHKPILWQEEGGQVSLYPAAPNKVLHLKPRALLNPGSVGQPRDGDPRAAYAIYDPDHRLWTWHRVAYDIAAVQKRMQNFGLPERNILRLTVGR